MSSPTTRRVITRSWRRHWAVDSPLRRCNVRPTAAAAARTPRDGAPSDDSDGGGGEDRGAPTSYRRCPAFDETSTSTHLHRNLPLTAGRTNVGEIRRRRPASVCVTPSRTAPSAARADGHAGAAVEMTAAMGQGVLKHSAAVLAVQFIVRETSRADASLAT